MNHETQSPGARHRSERLPSLDYPLLICVLLLISLGFVMVASASMPISERLFGTPFHFVIRHGIALGLALSAGLVAFAMPVGWWEKMGGLLFIIGLIMLVLVLVPGIGRTVNGATRWIPLGPLNLQSSEFMKFFAVIYVSGYLVRRQLEVATSLGGFIRPMILMALAGALIMAQPDFGTTAVMLATVLGLLFLGGVPLANFIALLGTVVGALALLIVVEPYRLKRIISFMHPFEDPFNSGYQLTQSLIAFGRGEWFGVGLGNGIQKQFFLPEAHTDFLLAVVGEELGFIGVLAVIAAFAFLTWRAFSIGARAEKTSHHFAAFAAHGFGLGFGLQAFINIGVNVGILPTKGLPLPFMSYGSNSLIVACMAVGLLLRIDTMVRRTESETLPTERLIWARA